MFFKRIKTCILNGDGYKGQLTDRFANLIEQIIQFKMMRLHLDRIADIALTEQEANREGEVVFSN